MVKILNEVSVALLSLSSAFADLPLWLIVLVVGGCTLLFLVLLVIVCLLCVSGKERRKEVLRNGVRHWKRV